MEKKLFNWSDKWFISSVMVVYEQANIWCVLQSQSQKTDSSTSRQTNSRCVSMRVHELLTVLFSHATMFTPTHGNITGEGSVTEAQWACTHEHSFTHSIKIRYNTANTDALDFFVKQWILMLFFFFTHIVCLQPSCGHHAVPDCLAAPKVTRAALHFR